MTKPKKPEPRPYRVPAGLAEKAEATARAQRKKTGNNITWTDVIRQTLEAGL